MSLQVLDLPDEALQSIIRFLPIRDVSSVSRSCKRFSMLAMDEYVWALLARRDVDPGMVEPVLASGYPPEHGWREWYRTQKACPRWGIPCCEDVVISEGGLLVKRTADPLCHATLSEKPLRGRVRFEMEVVEMRQYFQLGVCIPTINKLTATVGTKGTWVMYVTDSSISSCFSFDTARRPSLQRPELNERFGFAYDEAAGTLVMYRKDAEIARWVDIPSGVHACALLGGSDVAIRLHPASRPYPFAEAKF